MTIYTGLQVNDTATTLAGILQDIYFIGKCNVNTLPAGDYLRAINKYYGQLQEVVRSVNENFYMQVAIADLTDPTSIPFGCYTYPDGTGTAPSYEKIKLILVSTNPADVTSPLNKEFEKVNCIDPTQLSDPSYQFSEPTAEMFGTYFTLHTSNVKSFPVTGGIKLYYIATQDKLSADTDVPKIFPSFHDAIVQGALIDVAERLGNSQLKADSASLFKKRLEEIRNYASDRLPQAQGIVEGQENLGGWEYSFGNNSN